MDPPSFCQLIKGFDITVMADLLEEDCKTIITI